MAEGRVEDIYERLKAKAVRFELRPGDRLNEGALARELGASRTPLREALNRLVAEKLFDFRPGAGFFCRTLDAKTIFDLYELRTILETEAARLACLRADDPALAALRDELYATGIDITGLTVSEAVERDEAFHLGVAALSGNEVLLGQLGRVNERIRYIRWVQMSSGRLSSSKEEHKLIMAALLMRDGDEAARLMRAHISRRMDQITEAVGRGISNIFMDGSEALSARLVEDA